MYPLALHYSCGSTTVEGTKWEGIHAEDYDLYRGPPVKRLAGPVKDTAGVGATSANNRTA